MQRETKQQDGFGNFLKSNQHERSNDAKKQCACQIPSKISRALCAFKPAKLFTVSALAVIIFNTSLIECQFFLASKIHSLHVKSTEQNPLSQPVSKAHVAPFALAPLVPTTNKVRRVAINSFIVRLENWVWQTKRNYESDSVQSFGSCLVRRIRILPVVRVNCSPAPRAPHQ